MIAVKSSKIFGFNGVRALCVISVYLDHKCGLQFHSGAIGVWTFFVISGFLIIGELHRQRIAIEQLRTTAGRELKAFAVRRILRIFPAYYALLIALVILRRYFSSFGSDLGFRYHFFYLSNYWIGFVIKGVVGPFGVLWTLSTEQQFYALAPFLFLLTPSTIHVRLCLILTVIAAMVHVEMYKLHVNPVGILTMSPWNFALIAMGGASYILSTRQRLGAIASNRLVLLGLLAGIIGAGSSGTLYILPYHDLPWIDLLIGLCLVGLIAWIRGNQDDKIVRSLEWKPLAYLGTISYGFYLLHNFIPNPLGKVLSFFGSHALPDSIKISLGALLGFAITFLAAHLSWRYFESPILRLRSRFEPAPLPIVNSAPLATERP